MEELLFLVLQVLFEFLFEVVISLPFEWLRERRRGRLEREALARPRPAAAMPAPPAPPDPLWVLVPVWLALGGALGFLSLIAFPHTVITSPAWRVLNVAAAPLVSGLLSHRLATRRADPATAAAGSGAAGFWLPFAFTLGVVLVRYRFVAIG